MKQQETEIYCMCGRKRNKVIESMLSIMLYTGALAGQTIQTEFIDGIPWFFSVSNNEAVLIGHLKGPVGDKAKLREKLVIPDVIAGRNVIAIHDDVFVRSLFWHGTTREVVRCIEIPAGVTNIAPKCFSYFPNLQQIEVASGNKVYKSEDGILYRREQTQAIIVPCGRLPRELFQCRGDTLIRWSRQSTGTAEIPKEVCCIGERAFENCKYLEDIIMPEGLREIGEYAFSRCCLIKKMILPIFVTNVCNGAFAQCSQLTYVELPETLQALGDCVFSGCYNLKTVVFRGAPPLINDIATVFANAPNDVTIYCNIDDVQWIRRLERWTGGKKMLPTVQRICP